MMGGDIWAQMPEAGEIRLLTRKKPGAAKNLQIKT
jgi:hypothetical protein